MKKRVKITNILLTIFILILALFLFIKVKDVFFGESDAKTNELAQEYNTKILELRNRKQELENLINDYNLNDTSDIEASITIIIDSPYKDNYSEVKQLLIDNDLKYMIHLPTSYFDSTSNAYVSMDEIKDEDIVLSIDTNNSAFINRIIKEYDIKAIYIPSFVDLGIDLSLLDCKVIYENNIVSHVDEEERYHFNYIEANKIDASSKYKDLIIQKSDFSISIKEVNEYSKEIINKVNENIDNHILINQKLDEVLMNIENKEVGDISLLKQYKLELADVENRIKQLENSLK